ncbi:MAG: type II toxin-antitoxin system HicA family toxin [Syntrophaceae bacterium]|nr:type II toxin-antitoxin system HicA family toxin [Syntrophaceae bacterium]
MKRKDLIRSLEQMECVFIRHGGRHDWYQNPQTKISQPIPRHNEIKDTLAKHIIKMLKGSAH